MQGFGDTKILPGIDENKFEGLLKLTSAWEDVEPLWTSLKERIYDLSGGKKCLGYQPDGISTYISSNMTPEDTKKVQDWMASKNLDYYNTRTFKYENAGKIEYEIRLASAQVGDVMKAEVDGHLFKVVKGDYSVFMGAVSE